MSKGVVLQNPDQYPVDVARLKRASSAVLAAHPEYRAGSLSLVITDSKTVAALNAKHRHTDAPTDVLAFPAGARLDGVEEDETYIGDVIIARDYAAARAQAANTPLDDVLCLLVIHGVLHLVGYEHESPAGKAEMWQAQERALLSAGVSSQVVEDYGNSEND
ncbi:MAG: rRNA maturation RNase YbeY [Chloroflexi bacterium]|nr:rRNA maturation RNase YbeY [Chloroflexota bacterium]